MPFVTVYSSATGEKHLVPAHWLDHKRLSKGIRKTPLQKAADQRSAPAASPTPASGDITKKESQEG